MINYSSQFAVKARALGQYLGVLRPLVRLYRRVFAPDYEAAFDRRIFSTIRKGDCVWDVGANVGVYTVRFASAVGPSGSVVAFEPSPETARRLAANVGGQNNVRVETMALSDTVGTSAFYVSQDSSVTDGLMRRHHHAGAHEVAVRRADSIKGLPRPNVVKIDVEGFEVEVVKGFEGLLNAHELRAIFVEVHFQVLSDRGLAAGAAEMSDLLKRYRYTVEWLDPSHFVASRSMS